MQAKGHVLERVRGKFCGGKTRRKRPSAAKGPGIATGSQKDGPKPADEKEGTSKQPQAAGKGKGEASLEEGPPQSSIDAAALKAAILEANEGSSLEALAGLEAAVCSIFGVQAFSALGHGPSMLQVVGMNLIEPNFICAQGCVWPATWFAASF